MDRHIPPDGDTPRMQDTGSDGLLEDLPPDIQRAIIQPRSPAPEPAHARGVPDHTGRRPPTYPPRPLGLPSVRDGDMLAAVLPDTVVDGAEIGPLTVRAVSVRGDSHRWRSECRQDALGLTRLGPADGADPYDGAGPAGDAGPYDGVAGGLLLLAVADGVGSAPLSHRGSHTVVDCAARHLDRVAEDLAAALRTGDGAWFADLAGYAVAAAAADLRESIYGPATTYATTFRALVVPLDPAVRVRGFLGVGDGGLFRLRDRGWENLERSGTAPAAGGVIDTGTAALPDAYQEVTARLLEPSEPGDVLVLCTDGFSGPLVGEKEFRERLAEQWGHTADVPQPSDFLWQAQTRLKSYDDDRTVICLWEGVR